MRITATYRGLNGHIGYRRGQRYSLVVTEHGSQARDEGYPAVSVDSPVKRAYGDLATFLADWQSVSLAGDP